MRTTTTGAGRVIETRDRGSGGRQREPGSASSNAGVRRSRERTLVIAVSALVASGLSAAYVALVLRGGPRIVDATTYLLEARALAHGWLSWEPAAPSASIAGRFLVRDALGDGTHLAGIFPPGWPALLAVFVTAGAPMASGPVLAALVTLATAWLGAELARTVRASAPPASSSAPLSAASLDVLPPAAAALSAVCACLRYHTADTMSHGLSALLVALALAGALRMRRHAGLLLRALVGLALGWLVATRPVSGIAIALVVAAAAPRRLRDLAPLVLAAAPGIALVLAHQRAATGSWLTSSQGLYYALADGPPGCFRYGFGAGIGCEHEHGAFVAANLEGGYGAVAAAGTTLRRLKAHLVDPLNAEPLLVVVVAGAIAVRRTRAALACALAPVALLAAYAPFYFDGNYPGGGARFLADALPVEHVLAVVGALVVASRIRRLGAVRPAAIAAGLVGLSVLGFLVRARHDHAQLRDREGGRPMFEPAVVRAAGIARGLILVDTDHGFAIGHDPAVRAADGVEVLRRRGDALDRLAWEARGRPPTFLYRLSTLADGELADVSITPHAPAPSTLVEGESLWPLARARDASAWPRWAQGTCASGGRWLGIAVAGDRGAVEVDLPAALAADGAAVRAHVHREPGWALTVDLLVDHAVAASLTVDASSAPPACEVLAPLAGPPRRASPAPGAPGPPRLLRLRLTAWSATAQAPREARDGADRAPAHLALDALELVAAD